jgi:hypothetical protein
MAYRKVPKSPSKLSGELKGLIKERKKDVLAVRKQAQNVPQYNVDDARMARLEAEKGEDPSTYRRTYGTKRKAKKY